MSQSGLRRRAELTLVLRLWRCLIIDQSRLEWTFDGLGRTSIGRKTQIVFERSRREKQTELRKLTVSRVRNRSLEKYTATQSNSPQVLLRRLVIDLDECVNIPRRYRQATQGTHPSQTLLPRKIKRRDSNQRSVRCKGR